MFVHDDSFYLWCSGTMGWAPTRMYVYQAASPLGNFSASNQDVHEYHSYIKVNSSAWDVRDGYLLTGGVLATTSNSGMAMTFASAKKLCLRAADCGGFYFVNYDRAPLDSWNGMFTFRQSKFGLYLEKEVGMQPPPIPQPGQPGNNASQGEPGVYAYDSQSTYILPNPKYSNGSKIAPFIYMGDRWNTNALGTATATYVWLPLYVNPTTKHVAAT